MSVEYLQRHLGLTLPSPLQSFKPDWPGAQHVNLWIKRDDLIHPIISGNKWRKLSYLLAQHSDTTRHIISFGGGYSNHLHALGWSCHELGIAFTPIIRGNYAANLTPMLRDLHTWGAQPRYVTKIEYRRRHDADYLAALQKQHPEALIIPEGGSQQLALWGVAKLLEECDLAFDSVITPVASGATLAGLVEAISPHQRVIGIAVLKGLGYLEDLVTQFLPAKPHNHWQILHQYHHGGYARNTPELVALCDTMNSEYGIAVEPVYSGKVFYAVKQLISESYFSPGENIIIVHTGGLQGARFET